MSYHLPHSVGSDLAKLIAEGNIDENEILRQYLYAILANDSPQDKMHDSLSLLDHKINEPIKIKDNENFKKMDPGGSSVAPPGSFFRPIKFVEDDHDSKINVCESRESTKPPYMLDNYKPQPLTKMDVFGGKSKERRDPSPNGRKIIVTTVRHQAFLDPPTSESENEEFEEFHKHLEPTEEQFVIHGLVKIRLQIIYLSNKSQSLLHWQ